MISENDRINGEFYVDQVMNHAIALGIKVKVFQVDKYLGWGTPKDFENYEATIKYWKRFVVKENSLIDLSIVMPCYNEEQNLPAIITQVQQIIEKRSNIEVIVVNNGSTDNSKAVLNHEVERSKSRRIKVVTIEKNCGYGHGILEGLKHASGQALSWTHADLQTDPLDLVQAFDLYQAQGKNILVKGKRTNRRAIESFFTLGMQLISFILLKIYIVDINAQPKLFSRQFYQQHLKDKAPLDFSLDLFTLLMAKKSETKIQEIPVLFKPRLYGEAKGGGSWKTRIKLIRRTLSYILELKKQF